MADPIYTTEFAIDNLDGLKAAAGLLENAKLILYKDNITPQKSSQISDFTKANFDGYADKTLAWLALENRGDERVLTTTLQTYLATGDTEANTIYGWLITDSGETKLYFARLLDTPVTVVQSGDAVRVLPEVVL